MIPQPAFCGSLCRRSALLAVLGSIVLGLAGCATGGAAPPKASDLQVHGMLSTIELAPLHYAIAYLDAAQDPVQHGGIPNLFQGSRFNPATDADLAGHADTQALRESLKHPNLRIILTITEGHYRIVAKRSAGIRSLADLKGKRVAMIEETSAHFYLDRLLRTAGMDGDADVEIVSLQRPHDSAATLLDGRADALAMWEPETELAVEKLGRDAIILSGDANYNELYNLHTTAEKLANAETRAKMVGFVASLIEASQAIQKNPEPAIELVAEAMQYPLADVQASWPHHEFVTSLSPALLDTLVAEEAWLAKRAGREPRGREQLATLIDPSIEAEARQLLASRR